MTYAGLLARTRVHTMRVRAAEFPGRSLEILKPVLVQICTETQLAQFVWECCQGPPNHTCADLSIRLLLGLSCLLLDGTAALEQIPPQQMQMTGMKASQA